MKFNSVLLVHCFPNDNIGSFALNRATIDVLRHHGIENIVMVSVFREQDPRYQETLKQFFSAFESVKVIGSPVANLGEIHHRYPYWSKLRRRLWWIGYLCKLILGIMCPNLFVDKKFLKYLYQSDILCSRATLIFYADRSVWKTLLNFLIASYPLWIAYRLKHPFALCGHSFGPIRYSIFRLLLSILLKKATLIFVRERLSQQLLLSIGVESKKIKLVPDFAFALANPTNDEVWKTCHKYGLIPKRFFAITIRSWGHQKLWRRNCAILAQLCDWCLEQGIADTCAIVVQASGSTGIESDTEASLVLYEYIKYKEKVRLVDFGYESSNNKLKEAIALYSGALFTIGTRLHSLILSLISGTPIIGISYIGHKTTGILKEFGLENYICSYENLDIVKLKAMVKKISQNHQISVEIRETAKRLKMDVLLAGRSLLTTIVKNCSFS